MIRNSKPLSGLSIVLRALGGFAVVLVALLYCAANAGGATVSAGALVLVNSASPGYAGFEERIQPYLENFGVPYQVLDLAAHPLDIFIQEHPLLVIGHKQIANGCTNLDERGQEMIAHAVKKGTGLVNFDSELQIGGTNRYRFIQEIFGFSYNAPAPATNIWITATHFVTALHSLGDYYYFHTPTNLLMASLVLSNGTSIASGSGHPLVVVANYGLGRAVQWATCDWMPPEVIGPLGGLDDLVWRGLVWAAQKPFVLRGLPPFLTMRMDDVRGEDDPGVRPFWWVDIANEYGFKPWVGVFIDYIDARKGIALRDLISTGSATVGIHAFNDGHSVYFDEGTGASYRTMCYRTMSRCVRNG